MFVWRVSWREQKQQTWTSAGSLCPRQSLMRGGRRDRRSGRKSGTLKIRKVRRSCNRRLAPSVCRPNPGFVCAPQRRQRRSTTHVRSLSGCRSRKTRNSRNLRSSLNSVRLWLPSFTEQNQTQSLLLFTNWWEEMWGNLFPVNF